MDIVWDKDKNNLLKLNRNISFEEIIEKIINQAVDLNQDN
jgi:uncharacterized DUF497 family protein